MDEAVKRDMQAIRVKIIQKTNLTSENVKKIYELKKKYAGRRCFIIGSSPSLKQLDLTKLENDITFTVNRGYKLKDIGLKHTNFHMVMDLLSFLDDQIDKEIPEDWADTFLIHAGVNFPYKNKTLYIEETSTILDPNATFQFDLTKPILNRRTVIFAIIQAAVFMGFKDLYFIGVDLDFLNIKGHAYEDTEGEKKREVSFSVTNANEMYNSIKDANDLLKKYEINLYNASPTGKLDCIPRVKYSSLF